MSFFIVSPIGSNRKYSGYVILDPITGGGAYILDNGTNGGSAELADSMMADCAYANRPGFIYNDVDAAWHAGSLKCAALAKKLKIGAIADKVASIQDQIEAVAKFMTIYAKLPMVIADCMVAGGPLLLTESLVTVQTSAAMLAITTALPGAALYADSLNDLADNMNDYIDFISDSCNGG